MRKPSVPAIFNIRPEHRVAIFGRAGSGKTTLARRLMASAQKSGIPSVVVDPKQTFRAPNMKQVTRFDPKLPGQVIRINPQAARLERAEYERLFNTLWRNGNLIVYVDEVNSVTSAQTLNPGLDRCIRQGRELNLGVWIASQRPALIPSTVFTEAEHIFCFRLIYERDRKKVISFCGDKAKGVIEGLRSHDFMYYDVLADKVYIIRQG